MYGPESGPERIAIHCGQTVATSCVLLANPTTLLFVLRTVAYLWKQEAQARNHQEIAKKGAELYDKFVGFVTDLMDVGSRLGQAAITNENHRLSPFDVAPLSQLLHLGTRSRFIIHYHY